MKQRTESAGCSQTDGNPREHNEVKCTNTITQVRHIKSIIVMSQFQSGVIFLSKLQVCASNVRLLLAYFFSSLHILLYIRAPKSWPAGQNGATEHLIPPPVTVHLNCDSNFH